MSRDSRRKPFRCAESLKGAGARRVRRTPRVFSLQTMLSSLERFILCEVVPLTTRLDEQLQRLRSSTSSSPDADSSRSSTHVAAFAMVSEGISFFQENFIYSKNRLIKTVMAARTNTCRVAGEVASCVHANNYTCKSSFVIGLIAVDNTKPSPTPTDRASHQSDIPLCATTAVS